MLHSSRGSRTTVRIRSEVSRLSQSRVRRRSTRRAQRPTTAVALRRRRRSSPRVDDLGGDEGWTRCIRLSSSSIVAAVERRRRGRLDRSHHAAAAYVGPVRLAARVILARSARRFHFPRSFSQTPSRSRKSETPGLGAFGGPIGTLDAPRDPMGTRRADAAIGIARARRFFASGDRVAEGRADAASARAASPRLHATDVQPRRRSDVALRRCPSRRCGW